MNNRKTMGIIIAVLIALIGTGISPAPARAQGGGLILKIDHIDTSNFPRVKVLVTVRDENGVPLADLTPAQFEIAENNVTKTSRPVALETQTNPDAVVSVALVIDLSRTMKGEPLKQAQEAVRQFLDHKNPQDRVALIAFDETVSKDPQVIERREDEDLDLTVNFTTDHGKVLNSSNFLTVKGEPKTPLYDAAVKAVLMTAEEPQGRRAIILMTDGYDMVSKSQPSDPINQAGRYNIPFFPVGLSSTKIDREYLRDQLALLTGGKYYEAATPDELASKFLEVQNLLKQQYELEYDSALDDKGQLLNVLIRVNHPKGNPFDVQEFPTPTPLPPTAAPLGEETPEPPEPTPVEPTPTPEPPPAPEEKGAVDKVKDWIEENPVPSIIIGVVILLVIILVVLLAMRPRVAPPASETRDGLDYPAWTGGAQPPDWGVGAGVPPPTDHTQVGMPPTGATPAQIAAPQSPRCRTQVGMPPTGATPAPTAWGAPPTPCTVIPPGGTTAKQPTPGAAPPPSEAKTVLKIKLPHLSATLLDPQDPSKSYPLGNETTIGRADDNNVVLNFKEVSRQHAKIKLEGDTFYIYDIGSANGTYVDGQDVTDYGRLPLKDGDVVRVGKTELTFRELLRSTVGYPRQARASELSRQLASSRKRGSPEVPGGMVDRVHFSVTSPPTVQPGDSFVIDVWAHLERQRKEVILRAREAVGGDEIRIGSKGPVRVARGTTLSVRLKLEGLIVKDSEDTILWEGEIGNANFAVTVPQDARQGPRRGLAAIYVNGLQIARIYFVIQVASASLSVDRIPTREERHQKAFASYASADRNDVLARIQGMQKVSPDLDIFLDVISLRSGQYWEQELWKVIPSTDVFYLFWSLNAAKSKWVEKEWQCALETRGLDFIDPVPLISPEEVPPPPELARKHFNDWTLVYRRGEK